MDFLFLYIAISFKNKVYLAKLTNFVLAVNYSHFPFFHTLHIFTNTLYKTTKRKDIWIVKIEEKKFPYIFNFEW